MNKKSLYEMYLENLTKNHLKEVSVVAAHQKAIIDFGKAMVPFNVSPSICFHDHTESLSLLAHCMDNTNSGEIMTQLMASGYDVAEPKHIGMRMDGMDTWSAVVRGHGLEFLLTFAIPRQIAA